MCDATQRRIILLMDVELIVREPDTWEADEVELWFPNADEEFVDRVYSMESEVGRLVSALWIRQEPDGSVVWSVPKGEEQPVINRLRETILA